MVSPTTAQQPKEYCEHWVVCKHAHALLYCPVDATGKHHKECEYDTRTRPHPPAPELEELQMVNKMLEAEVYRLTGIEAEAARTATLAAFEAIGKEICDRFHLKPRPYDPNDCEIPQIGLDELAEILDAAKEQLRQSTTAASIAGVMN